MTPRDPHALLDQLLKRLKAYDALSDDEKDDEAGILLRSALRMLATICGPDLIERAYGREDQAFEGDEARRLISLAALSERLHICAHLFAAVEDFGVAGTIRGAAQEAYLVANGDKPRLFAAAKGKQGKRDAAYALAMCKCRALEWDKYLEVLGESASARKGRIAHAYGVSTDAMAKWPVEARKYLGENVVRYRLDVVNRLAASRLDFSSLEADGRTYQQQLRA